MIGPAWRTQVRREVESLSLCLQLARIPLSPAPLSFPARPPVKLSLIFLLVRLSLSLPHSTALSLLLALFPSFSLIFLSLEMKTTTTLRPVQHAVQRQTCTGSSGSDGGEMADPSSMEADLQRWLGLQHVRPCCGFPVLHSVFGYIHHRFLVLKNSFRPPRSNGTLR